MIRKPNLTAPILLALVCATIAAPLSAAAAGAIDPAQALQKTLALQSDPNTWPQQKVSAADGASSDSFGYSVAVSGDFAVVGALQATVDGNSYQGAAYVFAKSGGVWTQQQKLTASDGTENAQFGKSVAIDGNTILIGAQSDSTWRGAAYVFTESAGTWTQAQKLTASDSQTSSYFGGAVALQGSVAVVGEYNATIDGVIQQGAAYVFTESNGTWTQSQKLIASDGAIQDQFGHAVALDGATIAISAWSATINGNVSQGALYLFTNSGGSWTQTQKLVVADGQQDDEFGRSIALSGNDLLVGAAYAAVGSNDQQGAVYVFAGDTGTWTQTQKLSASDGAGGDEFGYAMAIDGSTVVIGAIGAVINDDINAGAAYVFAKQNDSWSQLDELLPSDGAQNSFFGYAIGMSDADVLIGAELANVGGNAGQGDAYFFARAANDLIFSDGFDGAR